MLKSNEYKLVLCKLIAVHVVCITLVCQRHVLFEPSEFYDVLPRSYMIEFHLKLVKAVKMIGYKSKTVSFCITLQQK